MIRVRNVFLDLEHTEKDLKIKLAKKLRINEDQIKKIQINKKSLDARKKTKIHYVYEIDVEIKNEDKILNKNKEKDILKTPNETYQCKAIGTKEMKYRPVIVGSGPAGLFCAYMLAENGFKPIIIERGEKIENRVVTVDKFWQERKLNPNSNVQFGEGGAGTFSDGKLNTLTKDKEFRMKKVFEIFVECGAPKEIMYTNNPHIGTDILRKVVVNMRNKIKEKGGEFRYNTTFTDLIIKNNNLEEIILNDNEKLLCDNLILAIGHSARDTFRMLNKRNIKMSSKPFAVGIRIIHNQELINKNQYGENYEKLGSANYKLTYTTKEGRGVYSFCMCPGGYVVNSSSTENGIVVNGMSNYKRDSGYANSAIVVTVSKKDYGNNLFDGVKFQETLEQTAYKLGTGNIPTQKTKDYFENKETKTINDLSNMVKGKCTPSNLNDLFPNYINESLKEGLIHFDKKIPGFINNDTYILGVESRTSSPVKFYRDDSLMSNVKGIYPCGEGSGYAGGITTSAIDGIKTFESIMKIYKK